MPCGSGDHRCVNCGDDAVQRAAEKAARLGRRGKNGSDLTTNKGNKGAGGKVALRAKVVGAGGGGIGLGAAGRGSGKGAGVTGGTQKVRFSVKSNFGKVRVGGSVSRGHYLYGRKGPGGGEAGRGGAGGQDPPGTPLTTPRPAPSGTHQHCDLVISPRKSIPTPRTPHREEGEGEKEGEQEEGGQDPQEYPTGEALFIPARSVVPNPHELSNDDLRFLFKYGVRLPVLSASTSGRLSLGHADPPAPPPTPPPASVDEHYLLHRHFLSQLPDARPLYADDDDHDGLGLCDVHSAVAGAISEISLPPEKPRDQVNMSTTSIPRDATNNPRVMTSYSGASRSSVLSKMASYSWRRADDDQKLPQVTDDLFYRTAHASPDARATYNKQKRSVQGLQSARFAASRRAMAANCGFCQKARAMSDSDDGSSDTSSILSNGAFRTKQLVRRINELEGLRQASTPSVNDPRSPTTPSRVASRSQLYRRDPKKQGAVDDLLYNQLQQSISWLAVPRETQGHIAVMGRALSPSWGSHNARSHTRNHRAAVTKEKDPRSATTYLEYLENIKQVVKQGGKRSNSNRSPNNPNSHDSIRKPSPMADPVDSVFAVNQPTSRPATEYEEQVLTTTFTDESPRDNEEEPLLVNGVLLESRPPPPNSPKHPLDPSEDDISAQRRYVGKRNTLRVDLRSATQVT